MTAEVLEEGEGVGEGGERGEEEGRGQLVEEWGFPRQAHVHGEGRREGAQQGVQGGRALAVHRDGPANRHNSRSFVWLLTHSQPGYIRAKRQQ